MTAVITSTTRNYAKEMRDLIDQVTHGVSYSAASAAQTVVDFLRSTDPELLAGWLDAQAVNMVREAISARDHSTRATNRVQASRSAFKNAAKEFEENGDTTGLRSHFLTEVYVVQDGTRMPLQEMTAEELSYVADAFGAQAKNSLLREAFLRAVAKKVKSDTVGSVMTEDMLAKLWNSLAGS